MAKVLVLAPTGFGKSSSITEIQNDKAGIYISGLPKEKTYILSATSKPLPSKSSNSVYPIVTNVDDMPKGKRLVTNNAEILATALEFLLPSPFTEIVLDDFNYYMQDWYMDNALAKGWDAPKTIGFFMGKVFKAIENLDLAGKNVYVLAHPEFIPYPDGRQEVKMKTTGKMVDEYVTPSGKFDIVLLGESKFDAVKKRVTKEYLVNENEFYKGTKSPIGMFNDLHIPNDLGLVYDAITAYYA